MPTTTTYTATIQDIAASSAGVWKLTLANAQAVITNNPLEVISYDYIADTDVTINPYVNVSRLGYHPYNALLNNASTPANTSHVQRIDYSNGTLIPLNIDQIRNNTAEKADVQEYVYNSAGYVRGHYGGEQLSAASINKYTQGDRSYGTTPVLESTTPYFCIFDYISGFSPEHNKANAILISYIVDEEGNVITPDAAEALPILQQGFPAQSEFNITIPDANTGGSEAKLIGTHKTLRSGQRLEPILYSYTAATYLNPVYSTSAKLEFEVDPNLDTYNVLATSVVQEISNLNIGNTTVLQFATESKDDANNFSNPIYTFAADTEQPVKFTGTFTLIGDGTYGAYGGDPGVAEIRFELTTDGGTFDPAYTTTIGSKEVSYSNYFPKTVTVSTPYSNRNSGEAVRAVVEIVDRTTSLTFLTNILSITSYESGSSYVAQNPEGYFFATGSSTSATTLTASLSLSGKYENIYLGISGSAAQGFNDVNLPFTVQPGDEIKFNNSEDRSFLVTNVETPDQNTEGRLYLTLNGVMNKAMNKDFFAIRRYVDASNMVLMQTDKVSSSGGKTGVLFPKYPSALLKKNYRKIISDLKSKGIL